MKRYRNTVLSTDALSDDNMMIDLSEDLGDASDQEIDMITVADAEDGSEN